MKFYLDANSVYRIGDGIFPRGTLYAKLFESGNIQFRSVVNPDFYLPPTEIDQLEREDGSKYDTLDTFLAENVTFFYSPDIIVENVTALGSVNIGRNENGNSTIRFNFPDPDPAPIVWYDNGEAVENNKYKLNIVVGATATEQYIIHSGNVGGVVDESIKIALTTKDFTLRLDSANVYGSGISRTEIETTLTENNIPFPLGNNWRFFIRDANNKLWFITYFKDIDKYATEKMPLK